MLTEAAIGCSGGKPPLGGPIGGNALSFEIPRPKAVAEALAEAEAAKDEGRRNEARRRLLAVGRTVPSRGGGRARRAA